MHKISKRSLDEVYALDLVEVIGRFTPLKKSGSSWKGLSPLTEEKTPSFVVSPAKNIWKCFSSGKGGTNVISFYIALKGMDWITAIEALAAEHGIELERENMTPEQELQYKKEQEERKTLNQLLEFAASYFLQHDLPPAYNKKRQYKKATLKTYRVGYAENAWDAFYKVASPGYEDELLIRAGLCLKSRNGNMIDFFRNRIMFPIRDVHNRVVAFAGRTMDEVTGKNPKYLNSPDSIWNKSDTLYGLDVALPHIQKEKLVYLVEGYTDVHRFWDKGIYHAAAACGTALTEGHIKVLRKYTDTVCIVPDNDIEKCLDDKGNFTPGNNAGIRALHRSTELLIEKGLNVHVLVPGSLQEARAENGKRPVLKSYDPDSWLQKLRTPDKVAGWLKQSEDYISTFLLRECEVRSLQSPQAKAEQMKRLGSLINRIPDEVVRAAYYDAICAEWKGFRQSIKLEKKNDSVNLQVLKDMKAEQKEDFFDFNFIEENGQYFCMDRGTRKAVSNFTMEVLFFVMSSLEPKYVFRFTNCYGKARISAITTDDTTSVGNFKKAAARLGHFRWRGKEEHLENVFSKLFTGVKEATEPQYMGYNPHGDFYTWANGIYYDHHFYKADKYGIVTLKKTIKTPEDFLALPRESQVSIAGEFMVVNEPKAFMKRIGKEELTDLILERKVYQLHYHYLPFSTTLKLTHDEDDDFEFERKFRYAYDSPLLDFNTWIKQMDIVYGDNGKVAAAFFIASLFRDIIYKANANYFPILDHYGMPQTGKSKCAESVAAMFGEVVEDGVNISSGGSTETGVRRYMASVSNGIIWLNEYKNTIPDSKIEMLKGIADGSGKRTGRKTLGNQTKNYKPRSSAIICGQDIPTRDPALTSRCIFSDFAAKGRNEKAYHELKDWERKGSVTHVTCELLDYRAVILGYKRLEPAITQVIRERTTASGFTPSDRAITNVISLLTPVKLLMENTELAFPFTFETMLNVLTERMQMQVNIQLAEDDVEKFFTLMAASIGPAPNQLHEGEHYEIKRINHQNHLFMRLRAIHPFYQKEARIRGVMDLGVTTLKSYLEKHPAYIETRAKNVRFKNLKNTTSAIVMNYDMLRDKGVELFTEQVIDTVTNSDFFEKTINTMKAGDRISFEKVCALLTRHNNGERVVKNQVDNYVVHYIQNPENKWELMIDETGITARKKIGLWK